MRWRRYKPSSCSLLIIQYFSGAAKLGDGERPLQRFTCTMLKGKSGPNYSPRMWSSSIEENNERVIQERLVLVEKSSKEEL